MVTGTEPQATTHGVAAVPKPRRGRKKLMPHQLLLKVAQGETIDGHVPTFAERLDAAKQVLPYYAPRLSPEPARADDDDKRLLVTVVQFADEAPAG